MKKLVVKKVISVNKLCESIKNVLNQARSATYQAINVGMVIAYWNIGRLITEEEQKGKPRADYGEYLIKSVSLRLTQDFGKGFSEQSLWNIRQFYRIFPILSTVWRELSWSHYKLLIRVENDNARRSYGEEAVKSRWSVRTLDQQICSHYYERLLSSRNKDPIVKESGRNRRRNFQKDVRRFFNRVF